MTNRRALPKKADIFIKSKNVKVPHAYYKPFKLFKISGIILLSIVVFLGVIGLFTPQHSNKMLASPYTRYRYADSASNASWYDNNQNGGNLYKVLPVTLTPTPPATVTYSTPAFTPIQTQFPTIAPINMLVTNSIQSNAQNVTGISSQIIAVQKQISSQMQNCANTADQMANQIITLKNQQKQLHNQMEVLNNQYMNLDGNTQAGQQQQNVLNNQIQQLQQQTDQLGNTISNAQDNLNNTSSQCQQIVGQLEQNRSDLESKLDDSFNQAMNIQIPD